MRKIFFIVPVLLVFAMILPEAVLAGSGNQGGSLVMSRVTMNDTTYNLGRVVLKEGNNMTMYWVAGTGSNPDTIYYGSSIAAGDIDSADIGNGTIAYADLATYVQSHFADDDLSGDDLDALGNISALDEVSGNILYYDVTSGTGWTVLAPGTDEHVLSFEADDSTLVWQADDDVPDAGDFGAATDLDENGALTGNCVDDNHIAADAISLSKINWTDKTVTFWPVYAPATAVRGLSSASNANDVMCAAPFDTVISNALIRGAMCWDSDTDLDSFYVSAVWELPWDFDAWATSNCVKAYYMTGNAATDSCSVKFYVYKSDSTAFDIDWPAAASATLASVAADASDLGTWDAGDAAEIVARACVKTGRANYALPSKVEFTYSK